MSPRLSALLPLFLLAGCGLGELPQEWELDRIRILAARSTPAELRPGELATLEALAFSPTGPVGVIWAFCDPFSEVACPDPAVVADIKERDFSDLTPEEEATVRGELGALGILGVDPHLPAAVLVPAELLEGLPPEMLAEGIPIPVDLIAFAPGLDDEHAVKRLIISEAATPNQNPSIDGILVDGVPVPLGGPIQLVAGVEVELDVAPGADAIETYTFVTDDGVEEQRTENLEARWYTTAGEALDAEFDLGELRGTTRATFTPSEDARIYVVLTDGRGGMAWFDQALVVE